MSDFNKENELDNYGVWVKKPPRTIESSTESTDDPFGNFDISTDLPDFSELDNTESETMEANTMNDTKSEEDILNNQEEEISLDEFITDGVFETGPDEDKIKEKEAEMNEMAAETASHTEEPEEEVSLDSFVNTASFSEPEIEETSVSTPVFDDSDDTLNIDLSFDDDSSVTAEQSVSIDSTEPAVSDDGSESVDLSEFGITEFSDDTQNSASDGTEEVSLDDFGVDFSSDTNNETSPAEETSSASTETEDVSLDDFGVDFSSDESEVTEQTTETTEPAENEFVVSEDKEESISIEEPTTFAKENDEDFNLDDILNSVEDENGKTVTVGNQEDALVSEIADIPSETENTVTEEPEIQSETIEEFSENNIDDSIDFESLTQDIPDTFDEETASLTADELSNIASSVVTTEDAENSEPVAQTFESDSTNVANSILQDIVGQLASLKTEISSLKTDFETLKNNNAQIPVVENSTTEDTGFFSSTDGDDTIALSTDELANILNTSEITQEAAESAVSNDEEFINDMDPSIDEEYENDLSMDFSNDNLVEPELDELDAGQTEETISEELPEDITIPKVEDLIVDSSSTDLMESVDNTSEEIIEISDDAQNELSGELPDLADLSEENVDTEISEEIVDSTADKTFDDIFAPDPSIDEALTEDKMDYLENDSNSQMDVVESSTETKEFDSTVSIEDNTESTIPGDLKTEIKSVLSYMDQLLENLPEEKIAEFAQSEQFETYKKLFKELGLS